MSFGTNGQIPGGVFFDVKIHVFTQNHHICSISIHIDDFQEHRVILILKNSRRGFKLS